MPTQTVENYLKAIFTLTDTPDQPVSLGRIGERVGVTPGTVTTMMRHLAEEKLVAYTPRRGVQLTGDGRAEAIRMLRRHRLVELFLVQVMNLDWAHVHEEAEVMEHAVSDRLLQRMDEMLGHPVRDPHGDPIPSEAGELPKQDLTPLSDCGEGPYRVVQVINDNPAFLGWLEQENLRPGSRIRVENRDEFAETMTLQTEGSARSRTIGTAAASRLLVLEAAGA